MNKELKDTVGLMQSSYYKARFAAEYLQVKIRYIKLKEMVEKWDKGELYFKPTCPREMYDSQLFIMKQMIQLLQQRARIEGVHLSDYEGGMTFGEAMTKLCAGEKIALPEWGGYWYLGEDGKIHAFTKEGDDITTIWFEKYCERTDWKIYDKYNKQQFDEFNATNK